ncbi:GDSL-type esterase/lipase family protein [Bacillus taeanensis]|uniref:SGNH hydrolase-type esterase domain-containing protein n=1 Tax=Bacillus taeanensis TaxID=273032 RepID=A0A366XRZ2_9BACI|nr:GDSL-type esterase/lipase family protein [Bacillus taeanensis]RBW67895.1 hypothetical protein DS031_19630 [Bacillus taeanensis]
MVLNVFSTWHRSEARSSYVALGDSIAWGLGAAQNRGYVDLFYKFLVKMIDKKFILHNLAVPRFSTSSLYSQLRIDPNTKHKVKEAKLITISIGGNNLLSAAGDNFSIIDERCAALGVLSFQHDWPKILYEIRKRLKSKASIYVMTLYNPYRGSDPNFTKADSFIQEINRIILNSAYIKKYKYEVVDVYSYFKGKMNENWKVCKWTHFCEKERDPHPTDDGHSQIYMLHKGKLL